MEIKDNRTIKQRTVSDFMDALIAAPKVEQCPKCKSESYGQTPVTIGGWYCLQSSARNGTPL